MTSVGKGRGAADSGFVGLLIWSSKWRRWEMDKFHRGFSAFGKWKNRILQSCTDPLRSQSVEAQLLPWKGKGPKHNASITGQPTCSYDMYGEKWPSTSAFFFFFSFFSRQLFRFDFNAFCVVLYFHAKILLYLNVFYFIKCVLIFFFWLLYPRIAVIILMSQYLTSFCERDQRKEENTKHFLQQCWHLYTCNTEK